MFPNFDRIGDYEFWLAVLSISLIASIQTLAMSKAVDKLDPYKRKSNLNKDLIGIGLATAISGAIGGLPIITVIVRSTVNVNNNAKTKWSNLYHGVLIIIFFFFLAPVIQKIPLAALASILVYIGFRLASPQVFKKIYQLGMEQLMFMLVTIVITLYTDLLWGILGGSLFTLFVHVLLSRMSFKEFFKESFAKDNLSLTTTGNSYHLRIKGIASFLTIPRVSSLIASIPEKANVTFDLSNTRLVGMTFIEYLSDYVKKAQDDGGTATIKGLDGHDSSSTQKSALKISLTNREPQLSPRQMRLQQLATENNYQFTNQVDWNTSYLNNFHFFEIRPIEGKSNCIRGTFKDQNMDWEIADVTFNEGAAFSAEVFNTTVMVLKLNMELPVFSIEKEDVFDKIFDRVLAFSGYKDIDFKMFPNISNKFLLMGNDEEKIKTFFTQEIIDFIENHQIYHLESNGEALLIFDKVKLARTDETINFIDFGKELATLLDS